MRMEFSTKHCQSISIDGDDFELACDRLRYPSQLMTGQALSEPWNNDPKTLIPRTVGGR